MSTPGNPALEALIQSAREMAKAGRPADAEALWAWARGSCLPSFGPFEDAMSRASSGLFHTRISGLLNLHRLLPATVVREAAELDIPLPSKEGFIRQVLGWREFVHHAHEATDGFRVLPGGAPPRAAAPESRNSALRPEPSGTPLTWRG